MLPFILVSSLLLAATAASQCTRELLKNITDTYIQSQSLGHSTSMTPSLSPNITYTENNHPLSLTSSILTQPLKIDHNRSIHDTILCGTWTELIITTSPKQYVIGTRILLTENKISTIESIVTKMGDWAFNATGYLYWNSLEHWDPIPLEKQDSRAVIKAAGDAYFNRFANINVTVPFGTPCARLEGGAYTGQGNLTEDTCGLGLPDTVHVTDRRYVIDETMGAVSIFLGFPGLDSTQGKTPMPDGHTFRVEGGKIKYIHTVSSCVTPGCGVNGTAQFPTRR